MRPLDGIRVLDWTVWQQGPVATSLLGDLGAEVIKIEEREKGDPGRGMSRVSGLERILPGGKTPYFEYTNRNKKSITVDLSQAKGKEIVYRLVEKSDVFVQNFRQGVAEKLGLDYASLSRHNPRLIYASATGYGNKGAESGEPTLDPLASARSGFMSAFEEPNLPPQYKGISDQTGAIILSHGILTALLARERFGVGQEINTSLLGSMIMLQGGYISNVCFTGKESPKRSREMAPNPLMSYYRCQDGKWLFLSLAQSERYWPSFCRAVGREDLEKDPRFVDALSRQNNARELVKILDTIFASGTVTEWMARLKSQGDLLCTPINSITDVLSDPQALANDYIVEYDHPTVGKVKTPGYPVQFSKTPVPPPFAAPELGQNTEEVLTEIAGYTWDDIEELRRQKVI